MAEGKGLFLRGNVWWIDVYTPDGERVRESAKTTNEKLARLVRDKRKQELWKEHSLGIKADRPFAEVTKQFLREKRERKSVERYGQQLEWWEQQFAGKTVRQVTQEVIIEVIEAQREKAGWTNATSNRYLAALRACLRVAARKYKWLEAAPTFFMYEEPKGRVRYLQPDEITRLLRALPPHLRDMAEFSLATGLRQGNTLGLRWSQVDLARRTIVIRGVSMKNGRDFGLPLNDTAIAVIRRQIGKHPDFVFAHNGEPVKEIRSELWARALKQAGITDFRWHDLRHTWATMLTQAGVPDSVLQELGAWETPAMVRRYGHHSTESTAPYAAKLDSILPTQIQSQSAAREAGNVVQFGG